MGGDSDGGHAGGTTPTTLPEHRHQAEHCIHPGDGREPGFPERLSASAGELYRAVDRGGEATADRPGDDAGQATGRATGTKLGRHHSGGESGLREGMNGLCTMF